jgi:glyoxylase I family protein
MTAPVADERLAIGGQPARVHHNAWVTEDQEATLAFYEDIIGLPLIATWTERGALMDEPEQAYCHTFFGLADGSALAFFQFERPDFIRRHAPPPPSSPFRHIALAVDNDTQAAIRERAERAGIPTDVIDHGYCRSLYLTDPNGLRLELTVDHPDIATVASTRRRSAHEDLNRWLQGDRSDNNRWRSQSE